MKINMFLQTRLLTLSHTQSATADTGSIFDSKNSSFFQPYCRVEYITS